MKFLRMMWWACLFLFMLNSNATIINTVVGGSIGDGGPALAANLYSPSYMAMDAAGNIYVAEDSRPRIRKVTPDGVITTVAGNGEYAFSGDNGPAKAAQLDRPSGFAVDAMGSIYISGGNRVRKITPDGIIHTVAGTGQNGFSGDSGPATTAKLCSPTGLALDAAGNLYISDSGNARIRKVTPSGIISTVVGAGPGIGPDCNLEGGGSYGGDGGSALAAHMSYPEGITIDADGNLYIADRYNHRVRKVTSSGIITTVAGNGHYEGFSGGIEDGKAATSAQISDPYDVKVDTAGNLYIAEYGYNAIRRVTPDGIISTFAGIPRRPSEYTEPYNGDGRPAVTALLNHPTSIVLDSSGNVYFTDTGYFRVHKVGLDGLINTVAGNGYSQYRGDGAPAISAALAQPMAVTFDQIGNMYVADTRNARIRKIDVNGIISTFAGTGTAGFSGDDGPATAAQINIPKAVVADHIGNIYIADSENSRIRKISPDGIIRTIAGNSLFGRYGLFTDSDDGRPATEVVLFDPQALAIDLPGNLYVSAQNRIFKVALDGTIHVLTGDSSMNKYGTSVYKGSGGPALATSVSGATGIAVDAAGNIYVTNDVICKITPDGIINTLPGAFSGTTDGNYVDVSKEPHTAYGITIDATGNLYVTDYFNHLVSSVTPDGVATTIAGVGSGPQDRHPGYSGDGGEGTVALLNSPSGIATDNAGNIYIADSGNARIRKLARFVNPYINSLSVTMRSAGSLTQRTLTASFAPATADLSATGRVFVAAILPDGSSFLLGGSGWVAYNSNNRVAYHEGPLNNLAITLVNALDLSNLLGTDIYIGYGRGTTVDTSFNDMLINGLFTKVGTIQPDQ